MIPQILLGQYRKNKLLLKVESTSTENLYYEIFILNDKIQDLEEIIGITLTVKIVETRVAIGE